jgi:glyoxylase-like metal-dependent hydrolase (beta-lactamase superfamily II)
MKNLISKITILVVFLSMASYAVCQIPYSSGWFKASQIFPGVWCIDDHGTDNMYVVIGSDSALLIDTGLGMANLRDYVKSITNLPLIVVNTHGHPDHAGANYQFEKVYAHKADFPLISYFANPEIRKSMAGDAEVPKNEIFADTVNLKPVVLDAIEEGYIFNLGKRKLEVIHTPGHTPGEICLVDRDNKLLFSGDNDNTLVWLHIQGSLPLESYLLSLEKLNNRATEFSTLLPGHGGPLDSDFINEQITCVKSILDGSCEPKPYESFAGNGMICNFKRASVAYNPENLRRK